VELVKTGSEGEVLYPEQHETPVVADVPPLTPLITATNWPQQWAKETYHPEIFEDCISAGASLCRPGGAEAVGGGGSELAVLPAQQIALIWWKATNARRRAIWKSGSTRRSRRGRQGCTRPEQTAGQRTRSDDRDACEPRPRHASNLTGESAKGHDGSGRHQEERDRRRAPLHRNRRVAAKDFGESGTIP
jgi:hypothetical protein